MRHVLSFLGVIVLVILLPVGFQAIDDARSEDYEQLFTGVATAVSVTSANVTLAEPLRPSRLQAVKDIDSTEPTDNATATNYLPTSGVLTLSGLSDNTTRNLTVTYNIQATIFEDYPAANQFFGLMVYLLILGIIGLTIAIVYSWWR